MRTTFGYSESTYDGDKWPLPLKPHPQCLGQGNGDAPAIWEIVSTPLLDWLWDAGHGSVLKCCIPQDSLKLVGYCFVYDYNIIQIAPYPTTQAKYTIKLSQSGLNLFSGAAQKTYGKVSVNKIKWCLLKWKLGATGKWSLTDNKSGLFLNPPDSLQKIECLPPSPASIILCVWIAHNGSLTEQTNQLRAITSLW